MSDDFPTLEELITEAASGDAEMMIALREASNELRRDLGDDPEAWRGAAKVMGIIGDAFTHYFGHDLLHHRRKPPTQQQIWAFAYVVAVAHATVDDGPST